MERDNEVNVHLIQSGWTVLRFWTTQIRKDLPSVIAMIEAHIAVNSLRRFIISLRSLINELGS